MAAPVTTPEQRAIIDHRARNVGEMFFSRVRETPDREAYRFPDEHEVWQSLTWAQTAERVTRVAAGLLALGIAPEERVAIASATRFEWILADLAINVAGAATTTVYPATVADDVAFILADSGSRVVFAEDDEQIAKLRATRSQLPSVMKVVTFDGTTDDDWVIGLEQLDQIGEAYLLEHPSAVDDAVAATSPDALATLIYTSGTTGRPKGVRLSHGGWTYEGAAVAAGRFLSLDDLQFLWLPMSHSFGKVLLTTQLEIGFPTAVDGRVPRIVDNLAVVRPTFMGAAPRIFEKAHGRIVTMMEDDGGAKLAVFRWAEQVGLKVSRLRRAGESVPRLLRLQHAIADRLVFAKVRERFGGRVRFFISGSAALSGEVAEWFHAMGVLVLEGYGLTETSAGSSVNHPENYKLGTVGMPLPGTQMRVGDDGEVFIKGPGVMSGYHGGAVDSPSIVDDEGWLATGDIGQIDDDGFLRITDRKKDLFKTSGGKYIAPSHIEGIFKGVCPLASQMVAHGNERNFCSAIITLDPEAVEAWASSHGMAGRPYAEVATSPQMREVVGGYVDELNARLNHWETIKKFVILDHDLDVESGEITPSLKVKRRAVESNYRELLDELYR